MIEVATELSQLFLNIIEIAIGLYGLYGIYQLWKLRKPPFQ